MDDATPNEAHDARRGMPGHHQRRRVGLGSSSTLTCAVCRGEVVQGKCRRCDRVGGETYDPAAADKRRDEAIAALAREDDADSDEEAAAFEARKALLRRQNSRKLGRE